MKPDQTPVLVVACFGHFMCHFTMGLFPALVLPLAEIMHLPVPQIVELSFLQYLLFGLSALAWGVLGDRLGGIPVMKLMFFGCGISGCACAWQLDSPGALSICLGALGLFAGIYHPIGMGLISRSMIRVNLAMGYVAAFGGLGMAAAPFVTGVINWSLGARSAFLFASGLSFLGLALTYLLNPKENILSSERIGSLSPKISVSFIIFLAAMVFAGIIATGSSLIFPAYFELRSTQLISAVSEFFHVNFSSNLFSTMITSTIYLIGVVGQLTGGLVGERFGARGSYVFFHFVCLVVSFVMSMTYGVPLIFVASLYFFFLLGNQSMENTILASIVPKHLQHSAFGLKYHTVLRSGVTFGKTTELDAIGVGHEFQLHRDRHSVNYVDINFVSFSCLREAPGVELISLPLLLRGRTVMPPTRAADFLSSVLVQGVRRPS